MRLTPYTLAPAPVPVALVDAEGAAWTATGDRVKLGEHPFAFYVHHDYLAPLVTRGWGRITFWQSQVITWEPEPGVLVRVLPASGAPASFSDRLAGVVFWGEYLAFHGVSLAAAPHKAPASIGSASWRLLRRSLTADLWYAVPRAHLPPVAAVIGGRQEMGWTPPGPYEGSFALWDISAAYARTLAVLPYGGVWRRLDRRVARGLDLAAIVAAGTPCFIRARVHLEGDHAGTHLPGPRSLGPRAPDPTTDPWTGEPDAGPVPPAQRVLSPDGGRALLVGPLPRRPRGRRAYADHAVTPVEYPRTGRLQGTWTADELVAALEAGCRAEILEGWLHFTDRDSRPFAGWWDRIAELRSYPGYPGHLGKVTGNALLGMFAVDAGRRREQWWTDGRANSRKLRREPVRPRAFDLFETVAGRVRSRLHAEALRPGAEHILCAHTDSVWSTDDWRPDDQRGSETRPLRGPDGSVREMRGEHGGSPDVLRSVRQESRKPSASVWRLSDRADVIDLLDPQTYAYRRPGEREVRYVMAGVAEPDQATQFDARWSAEFGPSGPQRRTTAYDHTAEVERETRKRRKVNA